jgi:hypothetical protein
MRVRLWHTICSVKNNKGTNQRHMANSQGAGGPSVLPPHTSTPTRSPGSGT